MERPTRRTFLRTSGIVAAVGLAGCSGGGDGGSDGGGDGGDGGGGSVTGEDYPAIDRWLTETSVGGADDTYDGSFVDATGQGSVTVDVGADGNNASFAFAPSAVVVSTGTTVEWSWTGEGGRHNVLAAPDDQIGESDYSFRSGEAIDTSGVQFSQTLDQAGVALYHCGPHVSVGMKGGIAVTNG